MFAQISDSTIYHYSCGTQGLRTERHKTTVDGVDLRQWLGNKYHGIAWYHVNLYH